MRHKKFSQRLSRPLGHRRATLRNMVISLIKYQRIKTTKAKAKLAQSLAERLITLGRKNTIQSRRHALKILSDRKAVQELFSRIVPLFKDRSSGFSRIIRLASRKGDAAQLVYLELTEKFPVVKPVKTKKEKPSEKKAPAEKVEKHKAEVGPELKAKFPKKRPMPTKERKPKRFLGGLRKLFKKERDSL